MKRILFLALALACFAGTAQAQFVDQVIYRDSIDASANTATATSSAAGFEAFKRLRTDMSYYTDRAITIKFTKVTDSAKIQVAQRTFGTDTNWVDVEVSEKIKANAPGVVGGFAVTRDTVKTWISDVGLDNGLTQGPFYLERKYIGSIFRIVSGVLDTGKIYIHDARMPR